MDVLWVYDDRAVIWDELSELYRIAPLGEKSPEDLATVFSNSKFKCFVYANDVLVGVGRALADGIDCSYLADVAVHPEYQGAGLGQAIIRELVALSKGHKKIILYANPGTEGFYSKLGFHKMNTAMAIWHDQEQAIESGLIEEQWAAPLSRTRFPYAGHTWGAADRVSTEGRHHEAAGYRQSEGGI